MAEPGVQFQVSKLWLFRAQPPGLLWVVPSFVAQLELCGSPGEG